MKYVTEFKNYSTKRELLTSTGSATASVRAAAFEDEINDHTPGLIYFYGNQGHEDNWGSWYYDNPNNGGDYEFTNEGYYPFALLNICDMTGFDDYDHYGGIVTTKMLLMADAGIIGAVGYTNPTLQTISGYYGKMFWRAIFFHGKRKFGQIFNKSLELIEGLPSSDLVPLKSLVLLGDPTLSYPLSTNRRRFDITVAMSPYQLAEAYSIPNGDTLNIEAGVEIICGSSAGITVESGGTLLANGTSYNHIVMRKGEDEDSWPGITFNAANTNASSLAYIETSGASTAISVANDGSGTNTLTLSNLSVEDCGVGIYANNSRITMTNCSISGSDMGTLYGTGVYLTNCGVGKVLIDGCAINGNGTGNTYSSAGLTLSSSSPEIIQTSITGNLGSGIACFGSIPDLNTYSTSGARPNNIYANGSGTQTGSDGAEIYLASSSYPDIQYNNVYDYSSGPIGKMIYKDDLTNLLGVTATNNWWGTTLPYFPDDSYFYWGSGIAITYNPYASSQISSIDEFTEAMVHWDERNYEACAEILRRTVSDTGAIGIKSVHYLSGCESKFEEPDYSGLRIFLIGVNQNSEDERVAKVARRFATDCLTQLGNYEDAMTEYDEARRNADCFSDSVMAAVDYLAVYELAEGNHINAVGESIPAKMMKLLAALSEDNHAINHPEIPLDYFISQCYPNPFNSTVNVRFGLPEETYVRLKVFDISGREVATIANGKMQAGYHTVTLNGMNLSSGMYLYQLEAGSFSKTMKMMLVK